MKTLEELYINGVTAKYFDQTIANDPRTDIKAPGWYWADKDDNARYSDFHGIYDTKEDALRAGREYRKKVIETFKRYGFLKSKK